MKQLSLLPGVDAATPEPEPEHVAPEVPAARAELCVSLLARGVRLSLAGTGPGGIRNLGTATLEVAPPVRVESTFGDGLLGHLARSCPGLLLFLLALPGEVAWPVVEGVIAGRRLNHLLGEATEAWMWWYVEDGPAARCRRLPPADDRRGMVADQRVRVRRAGPLVSREVLLMPPPTVLVPEDILHGEIESEPVTIEVAPLGAGFRLVDARGLRDRLLSADELEVIKRWLREVNAGGEGKGPKAWEDGDDVPF